MGVSLKLVNFEELFRQTRHNPIIVNDMSEASEREKETFNKLIYTKYSTDLLSNLPSCECGEIVGEYNVDVVCPTCHTPVSALLEQDLEPLLWMRAPKGVVALINPIVWTMINDHFERSNFQIIRWLCDTSYRPTVKMPADPMDQIIAMNIPRGYNNFVQNFDSLMDMLFDLKVFKAKTKKGETDSLQVLLREQRDCIFSQYLPLPNRSLLVIEETNVGTYVDQTVPGAVDAALTIQSIDSELSSHSVRTKENRTIKAISQLAEFYGDLYRSFLASKEGIFRKHVFGTRSHFSFRAVISSLTDKHDYDELHIPWGIGISVFRIHLLNKLLRRGFAPNEAIAFLNEHSQKYNPLLDEIFQLLINESPWITTPSKYRPVEQHKHGIPVVFQRNPSLERGSAQAMFITKVKNYDPGIPTVSLSILSVVGFNADFDGKLFAVAKLL